MKAFNRKKTNLIFVTACFAVLIAFCVFLNIFAVYWGGALEGVLGFIGRTGIVYESEYTDEELLQEEQNTAEQIAEEGTVLLKNENDALPLAAGSNVTLFGIASVSLGGQSTGSSGSSASSVTIREVLSGVGIEANPTVWDYYTAAESEADWSAVAAANASSFSGYNDAAIVVISRSGGESRDIQRSMSGEGWKEGQPYTRLSIYEQNLIDGAREAGFEKVIVLVRSVYPLEMGFADDADAVLICSSTGNYGVYGLANVIAGEANPSGHLVDTYVYDSFSAPAMQNFGDNRYIYEGEVQSNFFSYVFYAEGIYVGYKYYETRYEDAVTGRANVGDYSYAETVAYPFGYGLSYTEFSYSGFTATQNGDQIDVSVTVTNDGSIAGKDAVGIYFQSPYTQYDIENNVEKAAVSLVAFAKTDEIAPGASQTVSLSFAVDDMKSYDYTNAKSYIMDNGTYYITAAQDAHQAANNILAARGVNAADLSAAGETDLSYDADLVATYEEQGTQPRVIGTDDATGTAVTNQFDFAMGDGEYLSRSDWSAMDDWNRETLTGGISYSTGSAIVDSASSHNSDNLVGTREMDAELRSNIRANGWDSTGRPESANDTSEPIVETVVGDTPMQLVELVGVDYDDERWMTLIQQMSVSDLHGLFNRAGYQTVAVESIGKPATTDVDGPTGLHNYMTGWESFSWPNQTLLASTWNVELAQKMGDLVAEDALRTAVSGWYAPGLDMHRTPFGGRTGDYYSEDSVLSGYMAAYETMGAQGKGLYVYLKHFALNEQESNRGTVCTWSNEQAIREIYLKAFEIAVKVGDAHGVMDAQNRIGYRLAKGCYALLTSVLREEWGFEGAVITDATGDGGEYSDACLSAGTDLMLSNTALRLTSTSSNEVRHALQEAAKHTAYMVSTGNAMNSLLEGGGYSSGFPVYILLLIIIDAAAFIGVVVGEVFLIRGYRKSKKMEQAAE